MGKQDSPAVRNGSSRGKRSLAAVEGAGDAKRRKKSVAIGQEPASEMPAQVDSSPKAAIARHVISCNGNPPVLPHSGREPPQPACCSVTEPPADGLPQPYASSNRPGHALKAAPKREFSEDDKVRNTMVDKENHKKYEAVTEKANNEIVSKLQHDGKVCQASPKPHIHHRHWLISLLLFSLRLFGVGVVLVFMLEQSTLLQDESSRSITNRSPLSNDTSMPVHHTVQDVALPLLSRHKPASTSSRHLLELDEYERQKTVLARTEAELAQALLDLANSRHDAVAARRTANSAQGAYSTVLAELSKTQEELDASQRNLHNSLYELEVAQQRLGRTQRELSLSAANVEAVTAQLDEAYEYIDELYEIIAHQEMVATNALNFVAATAAEQQPEAARATTSQSGRTVSAMQLSTPPEKDKNIIHEQDAAVGDL